MVCFSLLFVIGRSFAIRSNIYRKIKMVNSAAANFEKCKYILTTVRFQKWQHGLVLYDRQMSAPASCKVNEQVTHCERDAENEDRIEEASDGFRFRQLYIV